MQKIENYLIIVGVISTSRPALRRTYRLGMMLCQCRWSMINDGDVDDDDDDVDVICRYLFKHYDLLMLEDQCVG